MNIRLIAALLLIAVCANAQDYRVVVYRSDLGLPTSLTKAIVEDSSGAVWVGTDAGLARFDGASVSLIEDSVLPATYVKDVVLGRSGMLYAVADGGIAVRLPIGADSGFALLIPGRPSPGDSAVSFPRAVYEARDGSLWISEPAALVHRVHGRLRRYPFDARDLQRSFARSIVCMEDDAGHLFAATNGGALCVFQPGQDRFRPVVLRSRERIKTIDALVLGPAGELLLGTDAGVFAGTPDPDLEAITLRHLVAIPRVSSLAVGSDGNLLAGTWLDGLFVCRPSGGSMRAEPVVNLPLKVINQVVAGRFGTFWVSSDEGIAVLQQPVFTTVDLPYESYFIRNVVRSTDGGVLATDGWSVYQLSLLDRHVVATKLYGLAEGGIISVGGKIDDLWIGCRQGLVIHVVGGRERRSDLQSGGGGGLVQPMIRDVQGRAWASMEGASGVFRINTEGAVDHYGPERGLTGHVSALVEDDRAVVYAAVDGDSVALLRFDPASDRFVPLAPSVRGLPGRIRVNDLAAGREGSLWLGTSGGFYEVTRDSSGMVAREWDSQRIRSVAYGPGGVVWAGTENGVLRFRDGQLTRMDEREGLPSMTTGVRSMAVDASGRFWVGTTKKIAVHTPAENLFRKTPRPLLTALLAGTELVRTDSTTARDPVPYGKDLAVRLAPLVHPSDRVRYQWRLSGSAEGWSVPSFQPEIRFSGLREGDYAVLVRSQRAGYEWSEPVVVEFTINPPFYRSWGAYLLYLLVGTTIVCLIGVLSRMARQKNLIEKARQRSELLARNFFERGPILMGIMQEKGERLVQVRGNEAVESFLFGAAGGRPGQAVKTLWGDANQQQAWIEACRTARTTGSPVQFESDFSAQAGVRRLRVTVIRLDARGDDPEKLYSFVAEDVTEQVVAERARADNEARIRTVINAVPDFVCFKDGEGRWLEVNAFGRELFQLDQIAYQGRTNTELGEMAPRMAPWFATFDAADAEAWDEAGPTRLDRTLTFPDGSSRVFDVIRVPMFEPDGSRRGMVVVGRDVTERHLADETVRASLHEKEVLLKEIHHRVKNNLQVITSLLNLQVSTVQDSTARDLLRESQRRVRSMALIHERLYMSGNLAKVHLGEYIRGVAVDLMRFYGKSNVTWNLEGDTVQLGIDTAVPCGLILNELISNSLKHGFPEGRSGSITVHIALEQGNHVTLNVWDDGIGIPPGLDLRSTGTMGMTLINSLTGQLGGSLRLEPGPGAHFVITFTI